MGTPPPQRGGRTMANRFLANVLHLEQCLPTEQQTVESELDVETRTVLYYVLLPVFIYLVYFIRRSRCRESFTLQRGRHLRSGSRRAWKLSSAKMEAEGDGTDGYELKGEQRCGTPLLVAEEGDSCGAASETWDFGGAAWVRSPCVVSHCEVGGETKDPPREPVTIVCKADAQRQQPTKNRHIYEVADSSVDMEAHEHWASVLDAQVKEQMLEEVNERYPFSLDDDDDDFMLRQLQTLNQTAAQSYLDWQNSTSQYGQDSWINYEDDAEEADKVGGPQMANRLLRNGGMDPFNPEFFSSQMYQRNWGTCAEDLSDNITAGQFEFYVNTLSHEYDSVEEDVPDISPSHLLELDMSNGETFRPYPFLETILEETAEDLQGESSGSESGSCSRRSSSSSFWNDDSESGSVIYVPSGKAEPDYGISASVEADLDACLASLDAEEEEQEAQEESTQLNRTFSVSKSNSSSQNDNDKVLSESSDEDDGAGRILAEVDLTAPQGNGESRSPSVTDSLIQFEALEKELDDDVGDEDPFASLDEQNLEFHTSATSQPFEDSFLVHVIGAGFRGGEAEEDCLSRSSMQTMVPDETPLWKPSCQRPWTSLAHLGNGKVEQEESSPVSGDSQPRSWRSEGNLRETHNRDGLGGLLKVRYDQSHYSSVGTSCWEHDQEPLEHEAHFAGHEGQDEEVQWLDLVQSAKMEQPWTLRAREDLQRHAEPELWSQNPHSPQSFSSEGEERDPGLTSSEESESGEDYSDLEPFESNLSFKSLRSALHMRSYCSYDSLHLLGHEARNSLLGASMLSRQLESVDEDALPQEDELCLPEADEGESNEDQSQSSSESLGSHPSGDFENTKRKLCYQNSSEALSEDSGYGDSGGRHITPPPMLEPSVELSSSETLVTSTPRRPRPLSLEEAKLFLTSENLRSPADVTREEAEKAEESEGERGEAQWEARSGPNMHSYAVSPPTPPLWLTAWAQAADGEEGENEKLMGTREENEEVQRTEEEEDGEESDGEGEVGLPDAKIGPGTEEQMPSHPQRSPSSYPEPAATVVTVVTTLPAHECTPTAVNLCRYPSRELVVITSLSPSPSLIDEDEVNPVDDSVQDWEGWEIASMGTPTRVALKRYGPRADVEVYLSKEAKLDLEEESQRSTLSGHSHKGVHFSPVVSAVNWRESYLEPEEDEEEPDLGVQKVKVIEEEVKPLSIQTIVIQTAVPSPPVDEEPEVHLHKVASLEEMEVISSKDINPPGKQEFGVGNAPMEKCKKEKDKEPLLARFSLARLSARMSATFHKATTSTPTQESSPKKENASSKKSKKDKKREKESKKAEADKQKKKPELPPKPKHLLLSKLSSKHDSPTPSRQVIADGGAKAVIKTAATSTEEADNAGLHTGEEHEQATPHHPGNDVPLMNGAEVESPHLPTSTSTVATPSSDSGTLSELRAESGKQQASCQDWDEKEVTITAIIPPSSATTTGAPKPPIPLPRGLGKPPLPPQTKPRTLYARKAYLDVNNGNKTLPASNKEITLDAALEQFTNSARQDRERLARSVPDLALVEQMSREGEPHYYRISQAVPIDRTTAETESTPTPKPRSSSSYSMSAADCATGSSPSSPGGPERPAYHNGPNYAAPSYEALEQARHKAREAALSRASSVETAWNATLSRTSLSQQLNGIRPEGAEVVEGFANRCRAQSLGPSGLLETSFDIRSSGGKGNPSEPRYREGEVECEEWRETNLDDIIRDLEHLSHSYFYVNRDPASPKAAPSLHHRRSVVGAGKARSMYNLGVADATISPAPSNHTSNCATGQDTVNIERAAAMMTSAGSGGNRGQEWDSSRAKSMEFLLDADNKQRIQPPENQLQKLGDTRQMSEHELRIQRSLQRLNVPEWYKKYAPNTQNDELDATTSTPSTGILRRREFGSGTFSPGASTRSTGGWSGFQRDSKTASMTSLGSRSTTPTRVVIPSRVRAPDWRYVRSSRESLTSPASTMSSNLVSPSPSQETSQMNSTLFSWNSGPAVGTQPSRWGSTRMSVSSGTASPGSASTYRSSLLTSRTPYLGWRSQEKLSATESHSSYLSPAERLANSVRTSSTSTLTPNCSSPATRSPSRQPPEPEPVSDDVRTSIREVTSAIVHYVTESTSPQPNGHASPTPFDKTTVQHLASSRSPSPRRQRCVWVESSFLGTPPPVARPLASPPSSSTPSPLPAYGTGRRTTDSAIDYGRAVMFRETQPALVEPIDGKEVKPSTVTSPTMEDVINSLLGLPSPQCALRRPTSQPVFNRTCNPVGGCDSLRNEKSCGDLRSASSSSGLFHSS